MDPGRYEQITRLFLKACKLEPDERARFLDEACGDDAELRAEVESLLAHDRSETLDPARLAAEVPNLAFDEFQFLMWDDVANTYNVMRGLLSNLSYADFGRCFVSYLFSPGFYDPDTPPLGDGFFYLVSGEDEMEVENPTGYGTCAERSNFLPCP